MRKGDKGAPREDVLRDREYAPCRTIALEAGFIAVQSAPLISTSGALVGVLSTHFASAHRPTEQEMLALKQLGELTANAIVCQRLCTMTDAEKVAEQIRKGYEAVASSRELYGKLVTGLNLGPDPDMKPEETRHYANTNR